MSDGRIFRPGVRAAVWLLVGLSTVATVVLILFGQRIGEPLPTARDSYADVAVGNRAFLEVLSALGLHVLRERRGDLVRAPLLFIEPEDTTAVVDGDRRELDTTLEERADEGLGSIVILPKWSFSLGQATPDPHAHDVLAAVLPGASLRHASRIDEPMRAGTAEGALGAYAVELPYRQWIAGASADVLLAVGDEPLVLERDDGVIVVADPDLVHNWNLHRGDHARLLVDLIRRAGEGDAVAIDEVFHGHGERRSLASALGEPPAVLVTAQALLLLVIVVWMGSRRFGPAQDLPPRGHGPAESIAVSAFVLAEGRPIQRLAESYVQALLGELAERLALPPGPLRDQAARIDRLAARRGDATRASALLERAGAISGAPATDALALAREAHAFRARMLARG